jgi:hypothetical protein
MESGQMRLNLFRVLAVHFLGNVQNVFSTALNRNGGSTRDLAPAVTRPERALAQS